jgi:hypothetical protein
MPRKNERACFQRPAHGTQNNSLRHPISALAHSALRHSTPEFISFPSSSIISERSQSNRLHSKQYSAVGVPGLRVKENVDLTVTFSSVGLTVFVLFSFTNRVIIFELFQKNQARFLLMMRSVIDGWEDSFTRRHSLSLASCIQNQVPGRELQSMIDFNMFLSRMIGW